MEEGQKNKFLSKSSIENSEFMTNIVEKKPNIFKRIAAKFSSGIKKVNQEKPQKSKATTPETIPTDPNSPAVPDIAPGAIATKSPEPKEPEEKPKNVDPIILINDRPNPFITLKDKYNNLDPRAKKVILIAAGTILALLLIILIAFVLVPRTANPNDPNNSGGSGSADVPPLENTIDDGRGGNKYEGKNPTSVEVNNLQSRVNSYIAASPEVRNSAEEYQNLEEELLAMLPRVEEERGTRDTVNYILTIIALGQYYETRGDNDKFIELYSDAISGTKNTTALAYYYSNLCRFYMHVGNTSAEKTCIAKILALDDSEVQLFTMEDWNDTKNKFRSRYNEL